MPAPAKFLLVIVANLDKNCSDFMGALKIANEEANQCLGRYMLSSWFDLDRNSESPQHVSECHSECALSGYVNYGINHGTTLKVDIKDGRFVFLLFPWIYRKHSVE